MALSWGENATVLLMSLFFWQLSGFHSKVEIGGKLDWLMLTCGRFSVFIVRFAGIRNYVDRYQSQFGKTGETFFLPFLSSKGEDWGEE